MGLAGVRYAEGVAIFGNLNTFLPGSAAQKSPSALPHSRLKYINHNSAVKPVIDSQAPSEIDVRAQPGRRGGALLAHARPTWNSESKGGGFIIVSTRVLVLVKAGGFFVWYDI